VSIVGRKKGDYLLENTSRQYPIHHHPPREECRERGGWWKYIIYLKTLSLPIPVLIRVNSSMNKIFHLPSESFLYND